eukprot:2795573-Prymnesium_polylepis.1
MASLSISRVSRVCRRTPRDVARPPRTSAMSTVTPPAQSTPPIPHRPPPSRHPRILKPKRNHRPHP